MTSSRCHRYRPRNVRDGRDDGFSAVELIVAISFFGLLMLGLLRVFPLGMHTVDQGGMLTTATSLAQDTIERVKTLPATDPDLLAGVHVDASNPIRGRYTRTWTVADDTPLAGMKRVEVSVSYTDRGIPRTVQLKTYLVP